MKDSPTPKELVLGHLRLVRSIANRLRQNYSVHLDIDELVAIGSVGLVESAARFDASRGIAFSTFAYPRIRGAIIDGIAQLRKTRERAADPLELITEPMADVDRARALRKVREEVLRLPPRDRYLVARRYWSSAKLVDIGRELGVSKSRATRLHVAALVRLRAYMGGTEAA